MQWLRVLLRPPRHACPAVLGALLVAASGPILQGCSSDRHGVTPYAFSLEDVDESASTIELVVTHSCSLPSLQAHIGEAGTTVNILVTGAVTECGEQGAQQERITIDLQEPIGDRSVFDLACDLGDAAIRCDRRER